MIKYGISLVFSFISAGLEEDIRRKFNSRLAERQHQLIKNSSRIFSRSPLLA